MSTTLRIRDLRKERGWTLEKLAREAGIHMAHLSNIERGKCGVTLEMLGRIADALTVAVGELLGEVG